MKSSTVPPITSRLSTTELIAMLSSASTLKLLEITAESSNSTGKIFTLSITEVTFLFILFNIKGISYERLGQYKEAIKDFTRVIEIDPDNANAYFNRGCCYDSVGELDLAISDYSVALELDMRNGGNGNPNNEGERDEADDYHEEQEDEDQ